MIVITVACEVRDTIQTYSLAVSWNEILLKDTSAKRKTGWRFSKLCQDNTVLLKVCVSCGSFSTLKRGITANEYKTTNTAFGIWRLVLNPYYSYTVVHKLCSLNSIPMLAKLPAIHFLLSLPGSGSLVAGGICLGLSWSCWSPCPPRLCQAAKPIWW